MLGMIRLELQTEAIVRIYSVFAPRCACLFLHNWRNFGDFKL